MELQDDRIRCKTDPERWPIPVPLVGSPRTDFSQLINCPEFVPRQMLSSTNSGQFSLPESYLKFSGLFFRVFMLCWFCSSASSPVKESPPESADSQDSPDPDSSSQESLPIITTAADTFKDEPAPKPKPDPDAWIQVEKRHRQAPGKPKVLSGRKFLVTQPWS